MLGSYEKYRLAEGVYSWRWWLKLIIKVIIFLFVLFFIVTSFFINTYSIKTNSMNPTLKSGQAVLTSPLVYGTNLSLFGIRLPGLDKPARGDLVVFIPPYYPHRSFLGGVLEPLLSFFTLQKANIVVDAAGKGMGKYLIKRIVGIPGDTIKIKDFIVYIKEPGKKGYKSEFEVMNDSYKIESDFKEILYPDNWQKDLPFSGNMAETTLGYDEYFLVGDNRLLYSDSRSWGPVAFSDIISKVILRYWPLEDFESL